MCVVVGNTLFVHGSVNDHNFGFVPSFTNKVGKFRRIFLSFCKDSPNPRESVTGWRVFNTTDTEKNDESVVHKWISELNNWTKLGIHEWKAKPFWTPRTPTINDNSDVKESSRGGEFLMAYSYLPAIHSTFFSQNFYRVDFTVMITGYLTHGMPSTHHLSLPSRAQLAKSKIRRIIVGHKPWGDTPTIIHHPLHDTTRPTSGAPHEILPETNCTFRELSRIEVLTCDQTYADSRAPDGRGCAVAVVCIVGDDYCNYCNLRGISSDGSVFDFDLPVQNSTSSVVPKTTKTDNFVGHSIFYDGNLWWIKVVLRGKEDDKDAEKMYLLSRGEGHKVFYLKVNEKELLKAEKEQQAQHELYIRHKQPINQ